MSFDPFAYRAPLTDADLDLQETRQDANNALSIKLGWITAREAELRHRDREALRETKKEQDRSLEMYVDGMFSTDESDFGEETPLTPPRSPKPKPGSKGNSRDLSTKSWMKECELMRLRGRYDPKDWGFDDFETWKRYQIVYTRNLSPVAEAGPAESINPLRQPPPSRQPSMSNVKSAQNVYVSQSPSQTSKVELTRNSRIGLKVSRRYK